jgi:hypothetical protein
MKRHTEKRTVRSFCRRMGKINRQPDYQRGVVWSKAQKQFLIDSIFRDLDIPKLYIREIDDDFYEWEIIDGQQRLTAIYEFFNDKFALAKDADDIEDAGRKGTKVYDIKGKNFAGLDEDMKDAFESYELDAVLLRESTIEEVEEMFLRLQNGTSLNAAEKRNAMKGKMKEFVRQLARHEFFNNCGFKNHRFAYDLVAAQMVRVAMQGKPCGVNTPELKKMYENNENFDINGELAKQIRKTLDFMIKAFPEKTPELTKLTALSLYAIFMYLMKNYDIKNRLNEISDWFIKFETWRKEDEKRPLDERDEEMVEYHNKLTRTTDSLDSVQYRHKILLERLFSDLSDLVPLDQNRNFSYEQRLAIYRRDHGACQVKLKCNGVKCDWDHWHADHIVAWSNGGETTVNNGQVSCIDCNLAKSCN